MDENLAFKCTYNDGDEGFYVGFNGSCSIKNIKYNIEHGRVWCSNKNCECRKFYDKNFKGSIQNKYPCLESKLFSKWMFQAGTYQKGKKVGQPKHFSKAKNNKVAILTTRFPNEKEENRRIIGLFKISKVSDDLTTVYGDKIFRIRLPLEESKELYFWDYFSSSAGAKWKTGLYRYLPDEVIVNILIDLKQTLRDENSKWIVNELLVKDFANVTPQKISGARKNNKNETRTNRISISRKYGSGGEGAEHKKLKEWVAKNPEQIGLKKVSNVHVEYRFLSNDCVDILFELEGGKDVVVEIETIDVEPGCHQLVKYKALRCLQKKELLNSNMVEMILVAWDIPELIKRKYSQYGIKYFNIKV